MTGGDGRTLAKCRWGRTRDPTLVHQRFFSRAGGAHARKSAADRKDPCALGVPNILSTRDLPPLNLPSLSLSPFRTHARTQRVARGRRLGDHGRGRFAPGHQRRGADQR